MALDIIAITLIVICFIRGYMKGIIVAAFSVIAVVLGIICALKLSERLATWLLQHNYVTSGWAQFVSYLLLFVGVVLAVRLLAALIEKSMETVMLGWINKSLGGLLYVFVGIVAWSTLLWLGDKMTLVSEQQKEKSKTYTYISPVAPRVAAQVGVLWPMSQKVFYDLEAFFEQVNLALKEDVDTAG